LTASGRLARLVSAALAGAAGLGLEASALDAAGLSVGFARASALGLGAFVAGWALGAHAAGRARGAPRRWLLAAGAAAALGAWSAPLLLVHLGQRPPGPWVASAVVLLALALASFPQGMFLPLLARAERGVAGLFAANLAGRVAGATLVGHAAVGHWGSAGAGLVAAAQAQAAGPRARREGAGSRPARPWRPRPVRPRRRSPAGP
jgi:hypothetical protein